VSVKPATERVTDPVSGLTFEIEPYTGPISPPITFWTSSGPVTLGVPNRLYGAEINHQGEAV
jgi:hypothetical protein